jgi:hypothetical protein
VCGSIQLAVDAIERIFHHIVFKKANNDEARQQHDYYEYAEAEKYAFADAPKGFHRCGENRTRKGSQNFRSEIKSTF